MSNAYESYLGVHMDTSGVAAGEKSMDAAAKAGDRLEHSVEGAAKALDNVSAKSAGAASQFQKMNADVERMVATSTMAADGVNDLGREMVAASRNADALGSAAAKAHAQVAATVASVRTQAQAINAAQAAAAGSLDAGVAMAGKLGVVDKGLAGTTKNAKLTTHELLNLGNQFQDLAIQIASGGNPFTALIQQGSQMSQVFATAGQRGIGFMGVIRGMLGSVGGLAVAFAPVAAAAAAAAGAFSLFHREATKGFDKDLTKSLDLTEKQLKRIKRAGVDTSVTMGDTFKATFQILGEDAKKWSDQMLASMGTSWKEIGKVVTSTLDLITKGLAYTWAYFRAGWESQVNGISNLFRNFPKIISDVFVTAFNAAGKTVTEFINKVSASINSVASVLGGKLGLNIPQIPAIVFEPLQNQFKGEGEKAVKAFTEPFKNIDKYAQDFYGFADRVGNRALKNKTAELKKIAGDAGKEAGSAFGRGFRESLTTDALGDFDRAFNEGMRKAMERGSRIVQRGLDDINKRLSNQRIINAGRGGYAGFQAQLDEEEARNKLLEARKGTILESVPIMQSELDIAKEQVRTAREQNEELEKTYQYQQRLAGLTDKGRAERTEWGITDAFDQFFEDLPRKGMRAFKNLFENLGDVITNTFSDALKAAFESALDPIRQAMAKAFKSGIDSIIGSFGKNGEAGTGVLGWVQKVGDKVFGKGKSAQYAQAAGEAYAGYQMGRMGLDALGIGGKGPVTTQNSQVGSAIGTAIGAAIGGPIGAAIGSFLGGAVGGLFGKETNATAGQNYSGPGVRSGGIYGSKRTAETTGALNSVISAVDAANKSLADLGGKTSVWVKQLEIGVRDPGWAMLSNGKNLKTAVGDPGALANAVGIELLRSTTFANDALNKISTGMIAAGSSFDDIYKVLGTVDQVLKASQPALSEWQAQLKQLDDTFKPLIQTTGAYTSAVQDAYNAAKGALATAFNDDVAKRLAELTTPLAAQFSELLKTQTGRAADAVKLGGDLAKVQALNDAELKQFLTNISTTTGQIGNLSEELNRMVAAAQAAGQATQPIVDAFNQAKAGAAAAFNTDIVGEIDQLVNPTLASLKALLQQQKDRLANASALGANVVAVERLNALQTRDFFRNLTEEQKLSLGDYLGLIEDYSGKIGVVLSQLNDDLAKRIDDFAKTKSGLEDTIRAFTDIAKNLGDTRQSIIDRYSPASPAANLASLQTRFREQAALAIGGNQDAANGLGDLAEKLIERSRALYGSTAGFSADYDLVTSLLGQAENAAKSQADVAQSQLDTLVKQYDLLTQIRDVLQSPDPNIAYLTGVVGQLDANNRAIADRMLEYLDLTARQAQANFTAGQVATALDTSIRQPSQQQPSTTTSLEAALVGLGATMSETADQAAISDEVSKAQMDELIKLQRDNKDLLTKLVAKLAA